MPAPHLDLAVGKSQDRAGLGFNIRDTLLAPADGVIE
jgi:hypothetical protein